METFTKRLPAHWASALMNGDTSGLDDDDCRAFHRMMRIERLPDPIACSDESSFCWDHDASIYEVLACDCLIYTFPMEDDW